MICAISDYFTAIVANVYHSFALYKVLCGILGQVWYLIVLFPDLCLLSYFQFSLKL